MAAVAGNGFVPASLLSYVFLSWSCFHSHSFGPGCWEEAWETSVWSLAAGGAGEEDREFSPCGPSAGVHGASPLCEPPDFLRENIKVHCLCLCWVGD